MLEPMAEAAALQRWWLTLPESQQLLGVNRRIDHHGRNGISGGKASGPEASQRATQHRQLAS